MLVVSDDLGGPWVRIDGDAEVLEYRAAMTVQGTSLPGAVIMQFPAFDANRREGACRRELHDHGVYPTFRRAPAAGRRARR